VQSYLLLRREFAPLPASLSEEVVQRCAVRLCAERLAVLAVLKDIVVTVQAGAAAGDDRAAPPYAAAAEVALTRLLARVRQHTRAPGGVPHTACVRCAACARAAAAGALRNPRSRPNARGHASLTHARSRPRRRV
jgi:hypothetical protein